MTTAQSLNLQRARIPQTQVLAAAYADVLEAAPSFIPVPLRDCPAVAHAVPLPARMSERTARTALQNPAPGPDAVAPAGLAAVLFIIATLAACGASNHPAPPASQPSSPSSITISISPATTNIPVGGAQVFTAILSGTGGSANSVSWSVNGIAGGNSTVGAIAASPSSNGNPTAVYTAPAVPPSPASITITAASSADSSKSASATATITCPSSNVLSPAAPSISLSQSQSFSAVFCLAPSATLVWDVNGAPGGNSALGTISATGPASALYTAPADLPSSPSISIHAVASAVAAGPSSAAASAAIKSSVAVSIAPASAALSFSQRISFSASVANTSDAAVAWAVNGIPNGSPVFGQICLPGSNPCAPPSAPVSGAVDFIAPAVAPPNNAVTLTATSRADSSRGASAVVTVSAAQPIAVSLAPQYAFVPASGAALGTQQFFAHVSGDVTEAGVNWSVQSGIAGQGCTASACGSVNANGLYTAPASAPSPNAISILATSKADPAHFASAQIAVTSGPAIEKILPSSVMAGAVQSFPLLVQGLNFVPGSAGSGSVILIGGAPQPTTCSTAAQCVSSLDASAVQSAATLSIQIRNPGSPGALSNPVPFVITPYSTAPAAISLTTDQPAAPNINFAVAEPTTAASQSPINVDFAGPFAAGACTVQAAPIAVARPASGASTVSICVQGNGLEPGFTYTFTGPPGGNDGDIPVAASAVSGLFSNLIELDLQISSTTLPGPRTLFITTLNNDRAAATAILEIQ